MTTYSGQGYRAADAVLYPAPGPRGPAGPEGPAGPAGSASDAPAVWSGPSDPPELVVGAKPGDSWINTATGVVFTLH